MLRRTLVRFTPLLLLAVWAPLPAQQPAGEKVPVDPQVTIGTLPNGMRYYIRTNPKPEKRAELRLVVNAGSVLEDNDQLGLAHLLEHMAFNGTKSFAKQDLVNYLESIGVRMGAHLNAYTSFDETVYMLLVPTDSAGMLEKGIQILEEWAHAQSLDPQEIDKERGVVIEEWRLGRGAGARIRDKQFPIIFKNSRYAERLPIGTQESLANFPHAALKRFYTDWYRPDLMAVVAVGDFDKAKVEALIKKQFSAIPAAGSKARPRTMAEVPDHTETLFAIATDKEATSTSVAVLHKLPSQEQTTTAAFRESIVESLYNGMLNQRLSELTQKADPPFLGGGSAKGRFVRAREVYQLAANVKEGGIERGLDALLTEAERVARHGFTSTELERQKTNLLRALERAYAERDKTESNRYVGEYIRHFLTDEPIPGIAYEFEETKKLLPGIKLEEVNGLARAWLSDKNRVIIVSAPEKEGVKVPSEAELLAVFEAVKKKDIKPYEDAVANVPLVPKVPAPAAITAERKIAELGVTEWTLANGVRVILKPTDFKADEIRFTAFSPGGSSLAHDSMYVSAALSSFVASQSGAGPFNLIDLRKALAGKAVSVTPFVGDIEEGLQGLASPKDLETLFQLIYLSFTAPRTDSVAFASLKTRQKQALANRSASPAAAFEDTLQVTLAQGHFRARPFTAALFDELELGEAMAFYKDRFADASDFTFLFVGSFNVDSIKPLIQRYLGGLPSIKRKETWRNVNIVEPKGVVAKTVRKGVEPQARTQIVFTGPAQYTMEELYVMGSLAEALRIRLREVLREDLSGTYGVGVSGSIDRAPDQEYAFRVSFGSAPERLEELAKTVFDEIQKFKSAGPSAELLQKVKEQQRRDRETALKENQFWVGQLSSRYRAGWDPRTILAYDKLVEGLTAQMIQDAAKRYLNTENYVRVSLYPENYTSPVQ